MNTHKLRMTLIEGHAVVVVKVDSSNRIIDVLYQGIDTRFFETLWIGNLVDELPRITPMICGVCSATHHVCSAKALDQVKGVEPPEAAKLVRDMMNYGIHLNNQALHLLVLGLPDFLPPTEEKRSVIALSRRRPELVKLGIELMELGHRVVTVFGGRDVHPINAIAGGVARAPSKEQVRELLERFEKTRSLVEAFAREALRMLDENKYRVEKYEPGYKYMMALTSTSDGRYNPSHGVVKIINEEGGTVAEFPDKGLEYLKHLEEHNVDYSYIRMVSRRGEDLRRGSIHVSALARLNIVKSYGVPWADEIRDRVLEEWGKPARHPLLTHYARVAEVIALHSIIEELLRDLDFSGKQLIAKPARSGGEGVGVVEAPRGTLIHHYRADEEGKTTFINIITPTAINAAAIEADLRRNLEGRSISELGSASLYAEVAAIVRAYDPCMSCATHASGKGLGLKVIIVSKDSKPLKVIKP